jgi:hypothetical protein
MVLESNIVYLEEEINNHQERLQLIERYLKDHPAVSVYKRKIHGSVYYYKKYWKDRKSVSEFLCRKEDEYRKAAKQIQEANKKRKIIKRQLQDIRQTLKALKKQLRIAKKAYKNV